MSSLVEVESYGLTLPEHGAAGTDQTETKRETNLLQLAWRSRWICSCACWLAEALLGA